MPSLSVGDPDLVIRTGGERRISNFLLYGLAYAELHFADVLWPDFSERDLFEAIASFQRRERRFGLVGAPAPRIEGAPAPLIEGAPAQHVGGAPASHEPPMREPASPIESALTAASGAMTRIAI
jgi:undecaprenyl diphosphate synthase